jgi:hypothetical protein
MNPEKRKVNNNGYQDQPNRTGSEVAPEVFLGRNKTAESAPGGKH